MNASKQSMIRTRLVKSISSLSVQTCRIYEILFTKKRSVREIAERLSRKLYGTEEIWMIGVFEINFVDCA